MANEKQNFHCRKHLDLCVAVIKKYSSLIDSYILQKNPIRPPKRKFQTCKYCIKELYRDFFVEQHYDRLPNHWTRHLRSISIQELVRFIDFENSEVKVVWPLSLIALRSVVKHLCYPRRVNCPNSLGIENISDNKKFAENIFSSITPTADDGSGEKEDFYDYRTLFTNPKFKTLFIKHVKPKKRYEIVEMAKAAAKIADSLGVQYLVDIGSGLGHLSRICGYGFGLNVLSVERQENLCSEAEKLDLELEVTASKHLMKDKMNILKKKRPIHIQKTITCTITPNEFVELIRESFSVKEVNFKFGIVGLHPCGNLALKLLQLFVHCQEAKFINIVGCCYHKITVTSEDETGNGFPISTFCQKKEINISYEARALACHALESYCKRLRMNEFDHLKIHCYRATLENIINKRWPNLRKCGLNNVKYRPNLTFKSYCECALKKLQMTIPEEDLESEETLTCLSRWKEVILYCSLRLMLAPLVETVILIDRMLYVIENGYECNVKALFEPEMSPRNFVLTGKKV